MTSRFADYLATRSADAGAPSLADIAANLGRLVFPCNSEKKPIVEHWKDSASLDPDEIRTMFGRRGAALIAMPTGEATGVVVVDVDVKGSRQGMAWLDANSHRLVQTYTVKTASGGLHLYFRWPAPVRNSASRIAPGIDVRGDGGYVIIPPSQGYSVADDAPVAEAPEWLIEELCRPEPVTDAQRVTLEPIEHGGTAYGLVALRYGCDGIRSAIDGAKHTTINREGFSIGGLVASGDLDHDTAWQHLTEALDAIRPACKSWPKAQRALKDAFSQGMGKPRESHAPIPVDEHPAAELLAKLMRSSAEDRVRPMAVPAALMDVPGALGMFVGHCQSTAISPQPFLALAAAITLVGVLAGRKYRTSTDLRTNIYAVGIADSGAGKDHARRVIKHCLQGAGLMDYLAGEDVASGAGLFTALQRHPAALFQIDEFGDFLGELLGERASTHKKQIAMRLKTLYSSASSFTVGTEYADQSRTGRPREDIQQPHACLYGTSTPRQFWKAITGEALEDGLMARILVFVTPTNYPDEQDVAFAEVPDELIQALQDIAAGPADQASGEIGALMIPGVTPDPYWVPGTDDANEATRALRREQLEFLRQHEDQPHVTATYGRMAENAMKLALVRAIARDPAEPVIWREDVAWGRALSLHCIDTLLRDAQDRVSANDYEAKLKRLLMVIRRHGPITERDILRKGGVTMPGRDRTDALATLIEAGLIRQIVTNPTQLGGRPSVKYELVSFTDETPQSTDETSP